MSTEETIREFLIRDRLADPSLLEGSYDLLQSGVLDSLAIFTLVDFIEERLGVAVPDDDLVPENFQTLDAVASMVDRLRAAA